MKNKNRNYTYLMDLEKYKDIFGKPREGLHSYRIFDIAIVDLILTIFAAYLLSFYINYDFTLILILLLVMGVILHYIFGVKTTVNKFILATGSK